MIKQFVAISTLSIMMLMGCQKQEGGSGTVSLDLTDAAVNNVTQVYLAISSVSLHGPDGTLNYKLSNDIHDYLQYPLLDYNGGISASLLKDAQVAPGAYHWIRLNLATEGNLDSYVELEDGSIHELEVISETGLKLNRGFYVPEDGNVSFTLDLDLQKSLIQTKDGYRLKPVIRVVNNDDIGRIAGRVDASLLSGNRCHQAAMYLFRGYDAEPSDINPKHDPEVIAPVNLENDNAYHFGFISSGEYSLALACDPLDDPEVEDEMNFLRQKNVLVRSSYTTFIHMDL
ncbi:DUF4382 domain-containing protein [Gynuella sp.]|uniref:DUF4382 domain-containing protein n=1 Tax=Gynuella sp. TaxID=2969146 RepID=UPI003D10E1D2